MTYNRSRLALALTIAGALVASTPVLADCSGFKWPLDTELGWMAAGDDVKLSSGEALPALPGKAITLKLAPAKSVKMPVAVGVKEDRIASDTFSGWLTIDGMKPGLYQISLAANGWIDAAQNGALIRSKGFTGRQECKAIHKSVRFEVGSGPLTVQISGAPSETLRLTINEGK